jgi:putative transposase
MDALRHGPHSAFSIHLHLVWVSKYRKAALAGAVGLRVSDLIREIWGTLNVHIIRGHVSRDHVHLLVSIPPPLAVSW